jgi:hypothetical protein
MADSAGRERRVVSQHRLAKQGFGDRSAEPIRNPAHLFARVQSALSNQNRDLPPAVQDIRGGPQLIGRRLVDDRNPRGRSSRAGLPMERLSAAKRIICVSFDTVR